jgi:pimeloyl-ACP methyl ester carboxylesterase
VKIADVEVIVEGRGEKSILMLHGWPDTYRLWDGLFGYQFAVRYPQMVERIVGVDVGDAGSRGNVAELSLKAKAMVVGYQVWLALAWRIGGAPGDRMARAMARALHCPAAREQIHSRMGYPYALRWLGVAGGLRGLKAFRPQVPMLFIYGSRKPFMFHSRAWAERLAELPASRAIALPTGHWVMLGRAREFNDALSRWLAATD